MKKIIFAFMLSVLLCISGCAYFTNSPISEIPETLYENYDINCLKSTDVTYNISNQSDIYVIIDGKKELIRFTDDWYIVHKDWIKTFNENQDTIINLLNQKKSLK